MNSNQPNTNTEFNPVSSTSRRFNLVFWLMLAMVLIMLGLSSYFNASFFNFMAWFAWPIGQECRNFSDPSVVPTVISCGLLLAIALDYCLILTARTRKSFGVFSVLGFALCSTWFLWGIGLFVVCGLRH